MRKIFTGLIVCSVLLTAGCNEEEEEADRAATAKRYARMEITSGGENMGEILIELFAQKTPETVNNFVSLAEGEKEFRDSNTGEWKTGRFYDGLIFHRVIEGFMIQGGDPMGTGRGGPGYRFDCEIVDELSFDRPGLLAMANSGPNTNGSQFFITVAPAPWLDGRHTIFGEVIEGMDIVYEISGVATGPGDRPVEPVVMEEVEIKRAE